ncbi:MAG: hypothetical protein K2N24_03620, partial [Lachnospiraceae bacterium]|nr:hypothetical protein [Lachnospiraceae bacterium]
NADRAFTFGQMLCGFAADSPAFCLSFPAPTLHSIYAISYIILLLTLSIHLSCQFNILPIIH